MPGGAADAGSRAQQDPGDLSCSASGPQPNPGIAADAGSRAADVPRSRRGLLRGGATALVASVLGVFGVAIGAAAKNGDPLRAGEKTSATRPTTLESSEGPALQARVTGREGVALRGSASSPKGIGVQGEASSDKGESVGVQGTSQSPDGVAGRFTAEGGGTALEASVGKREGVALRTRGRLELTERSGISSVSGGAEFVIPVAGGLSDTSIVLATLQDHLPGVHVEAAGVLDAEEGLIVVRLNQAVPEPAKVAWLVLD
jgi:hypothetical protein